MGKSDDDGADSDQGSSDRQKETLPTDSNRLTDGERVESKCFAKLKTAKVKRANAKRKFTRKINGFCQRYDGGDPLECLTGKFNEVYEAYQELEGTHQEFLVLIVSDATDEESVMEDADDYMEEVDDRLDEARAKLVIKSKEREEGLKAPDVSQSELVSVLHKMVDYSKPNVSKPSLNIKRLDTPTFSGKIRDYPNFKRDYQRLVNHNFEKDPYALKCCLIGEALDVVKGVDDNYNEMFKRLDEKYGNPRKIADAVISELRKMKPVPDGDGKRFITMVDTVERGWLDLHRMNLSAEMNNATMVSQIERLLPSVQKREWVLSMDNNDDSDTLFENMLKFLLREKRALEYMENDMRSSNNVGLKATVYNTEVDTDISEAVCSESSKLVTVMQTMQERQHRHQENIQENMINMTRMIANLVSQQSGHNETRSNVSGQGAFKNMYSDPRIRCWYHATNSHTIVECTAFRSLNMSEKLEAVRKSRSCFCCLKIGHVAKYCHDRKPCSISDGLGKKCEILHHPLLHQFTSSGTTVHNAVHITNTLQEREVVLLMFNKILCKNHSVVALWDPGANMSLITHRAARKLGLNGIDVKLSITKVGNQTEWLNTKEYVVPLTDIQGNIWEIRAYGIEEVTGDIVDVDISRIAPLFQGIKVRDILRPVGRVDLLIGIDCCLLQPKVIESRGNLQLMENQFGYCIRGAHPLIGQSNERANFAGVKINHLAVATQVNSLFVEPIISLKNNLDEFFAVDNLGTFCHSKCGGCRCGRCAPGNSDYSLQEERELALIKKGLVYDPETKSWTAHYPWIKSPMQLPNNVTVAIFRMKSRENRLKRLGHEHVRAYQDQMQDMLSRNVARKLSVEEMKEYKGPVHYVQHHEIVKPESTSTPLRIVFNSSASYMGHVLNEYWGKGPDVLNNLFAILIRFRQNSVALVGDVAKMYNTVRLLILEQHTHRFVWRDMQLDREPEHYALTAVAFGDRPSVTISMMALKGTAEMHKEHKAAAADMIIRNSYVDDLLQSVRSRDEACKLARDVEEVLGTGGFKIKHWIISGYPQSYAEDINVHCTNEEKVLGLMWNPRKDCFSFKIKVSNLLWHGDIHQNRSEIFDMHKPITKRMILSQTASVYDPLGLAIPFTLEAKILMHAVVTSSKVIQGKEQRLDWDDPIPDHVRQKWMIFFHNLFSLEQVTFSRCVKPKNTIGDPMLVVYCDGSTQAYGSCAYIRWEIKYGGFEARLIAAKNRIAPTRQLSVPRLELCGAILGCRLAEFIQREMEFVFTDVMYIVDSSIVRAQIQKESYGFGSFVATKIAEIQKKCSNWRYSFDPG